ncbi:MAG: hypothetical protein M1838_000862 [Thelocarpon superellum]|nr:MAG: hypothetical protein M1838_000862 [Thelocarpon superellum]
MDPHNTPVLPPPAGVTPNFVDPPSKAYLETAFSIFCPVLAGVFVIARVISRLWISRAIGLDDVMSVFAMAISIAFSVSLIVREPTGIGKHLWDVRLSDFAPRFGQWFVAAAVLYDVFLFAFKMAILLLYRRLFSVNKRFMIVAYTVMFFISSYTLAGLFVIIFECSPYWKVWDPQVPGSCLNTEASATTFAVFNVLTDVAVLLMPMPVVMKLQLERRIRWGLFFVFLTGALVVVVSISRLVATVVTYSNPDLTWGIVTWDIASYAPPTLLFAAIPDPSSTSLFEGNVGIIVGCLPVVLPLVQRLVPCLMTRSQRSSMRRTTAKTDPSSQARKYIDSEEQSDGTYVEMDSKPRTTVSSGKESRGAAKSATRTENESQEAIIDSHQGTGIMKTVGIDLQQEKVGDDYPSSLALSSPTRTDILQNELLTLPNKQQIGYTAVNPRSTAHHVFFVHGFPSSQLEGLALTQLAHKRGLCIISPDWPGIGLASPLVVGGSGGRPYAMACAKESPALLLSRRLNRVAVLAGVGPIADPGYVGYKDMRCETRWLLKGTYRFPGLVRACLNTFVVPRALHPDPEAWWRHMMAQLEYAKKSERELLVKDSEAFALLLRITREHFRQGGGAFMDEAALVMRPWGFALDEDAFGREGDE